MPSQKFISKWLVFQSVDCRFIFTFKCTCLDPMWFNYMSAVLFNILSLFQVTTQPRSSQSTKISSPKLQNRLQRRRNHKTLFETLHLIFSKTRLARFLTAAERTNLEENVINLSKIIFLKFKHKSITIKMHDVLGELSNINFSHKFNFSSIYKTYSTLFKWNFCSGWWGSYFLPVHA